MNVYEK